MRWPRLGRPVGGTGCDTTTDKRRSGGHPGLDAAGTREATGTGTRLNAGLNIVPFPFTYLYVAIGGANGNTTGQAGLGARFGGVI